VVFPRHRPPLSVKKTGSSSRELHSPSEFFESPSARCVTAPSAFHGVSSLLAVPALRVHMTAGSQPAFVPPAAFLTLSTAYSSDCLAGLFHPAATSRVSLQGFPLASQPDTSSMSHPLSPLASSSYQQLPTSSSSRRVDLRVLIRLEIRNRDGGFSPTTIRIPSCASLPRALLRKPRRRGKRPLHSRSFRAVLRVPYAMILSVCSVPDLRFYL
jgi:hypothetical protein